MKKPIIRILSLVLILTHIFTICLRDVSFAAQSSSSSSGTSTANSGASTTKSTTTSTQSPTKPTTGSAKTKDTASSAKSMSLAAASSSSSPQMSTSFNTSVLKSFQSDPFTGRAMFSVPINVPVGRKGVQPNIALTYASGSGNGILGVGWSLELGSIQRSTKRGVPKYDSTDTFIFNSQGSNQELVNIGGNEYRSKIEGSFSRFTFDGTSWVITDKGGTKYYFGQTENSKQICSKGAFSWYLTKVEDVNTNYMEISYTQDQNQIYPDKIIYTGNSIQRLTTANSVEFLYEARLDTPISSRSGFNIVAAKRLKTILVKFNSSFICQYKVEYLAIDNTRPFSFINQVAILGQDGTTSLPPIKFEYYDTKPTFSQNVAYWSNVNNCGYDDPTRWNIRSGQSNRGVTTTIADMRDVNGDGLPDRILSSFNSPPDRFVVQLNNGHGFDDPLDFRYPYTNTEREQYISFTENDGQIYPLTYSDMFDVDGDGFIDKVCVDFSDRTRFKVWRNLGNLTFDTNATYWINVNSCGFDHPTRWNIRSGLSNKGVTVNIADMRDINGDGLPDRVMYSSANYNTCYQVQLNTGNSFSNPADFSYPYAGTEREQYISFTENDGLIYPITKFELFDINGDGLLDKVAMDDTNYTHFKVWLNQGSSFDANVTLWNNVGNYGYEDLISWGIRSGQSNKGIVVCIGDIKDINGDGLADRIIRSFFNPSNCYQVQLNTGSGFADSIDLAYPYTDIEREQYISWTQYDGLIYPDTYTDLFDINGDGLPDKVAVDTDNHTRFKVWLNTTTSSGYLKKIDNGIGGNVEVEYASSSQFDNKASDGLNHLPFNVWVVKKIASSDGQGSVYSTNYDYKGGYFSTTDREFRGFGYVKTTDSEGSSSESYFKQDSIFKARPYKQEVKDKDSKLYSKTENTWQSVELYPGVNFPYLVQTDNYVYYPDNIDNYKQTRVKYEYDSFGNPKKVISEGEVAVTGDEKTQITEYIYNITDWILSCPKSTILLDKSQTKVSEKRFYYDNHTTLDEIPTKGFITKEESSLKDPIKNTQKYISSSYAYDTYGNLTSSTDALGRTTSTVYDPVQFSYPIQTTNALGKTIKTVYYGINDSLQDAITGSGLPGQVKSTEDYNTQKNYNIYDSLGRITKAIGPLDTEDYPGAIYEYDLSAQPIKVVRKVKVDYSAQPAYLSSYSFYDGLGRVIEDKTPAENNPVNNQPRQIISGLVRYDSRGQIKEKYLPYFVDASANYESPVYNTPHSSFIYDALGRLTQSINPDLTSSSVSYGVWSKITIDENNHSKGYYFDSYGKITKVEEHNSGQIYTTKYEYDTLGNLIKLTDNQNNVTQIWYDSLGRKVKMDDPDMGIWLYEYDALGNLTKQTDAKGQVLRFTYDVLSRLLRKINYTNAASPITLVTYTYDSAAKSYCIGRLSKVTDLSGSTDFYYDKLGRETKSTKTITGSGTYTVERTYDALDRLLTLKYPDSTLITYSYNPQGIEKVSSLRAPEGGEAISYISNIDYSPTGQLTKIQYGNGTQTNYAYEPNTIRLNNIVTQSPAGKIQDLSYQFDNTGNIRNIVDAVNTATQSFVYDDLNRLISASGSYGALSYAYDSIGNMINKEGVNLTYGEGSAGPHAVTSLRAPEGGEAISISYDANGNMIQKGDLSLTYDVENRLKEAQRVPPQPVTISITLKPGWNFFSLPVIPQDTKVSSVLAQISGKYSQISRYSPNTKTFEHNVANTKFDQFTDFEYGKGYQIYITSTSDVNLNITGTLQLTTQSISLVAGENLIFCPKTTETTVEAALFPLKLDTDYSKVVYYNKFLNKFEEYSSIKQEFTTLKPGTSYYIICLKDTTLTVSGSQQPPVSFTYDGDGGRVRKSSLRDAEGGEAISTTYIGSLYEINSDGTTTKHIFSGSNRIASSLRNAAGVEAISYFHSDHLGSSNIITDSSGKQIGFTEFTPYGSTFKQTGSFDPKHKFTGKELDSSTGLYYYGARYYDPFFGRFITPDTIVQAPYDPQSLNRYSYCRNNPINLVDPTGHSWWKNIFKAIGIAVAGIALTIFSGGALAPLVGTYWAGVATGAFMGATIGGSFAAATGGNIGMGLLTGFVGGAVFAGLAPGLGTLSDGVFRGITLGGAQGPLTAGASMGSNFVAGFLGGAASGAAVAGINGADVGQTALMGGAMAGGFSLLSDTAYLMRTKEIQNSELDPLGRNSSGKSSGIRGDNFKLAGARYNRNNPNAWPAPFGGNQGGQGKIFGFNYPPNGIVNHILESWAGPHDWLNGWTYDSVGNLRQLNLLESGINTFTNPLNIAIAAPLAIPLALPQQAAAAPGIIYGSQKE
ncbi:MAG: hypothetical protein HZC11_07350 [Nitrospirae bacterium]|nr:hypothetical protein [Nitrospirota bacterium]